ncbi:hypothetical protein FPE53_25560, partial [Salmonella enterica subsp. enterica]|nr:hypothetical protein [Salmonella enterica subsp. enterica serovar Aqua]
MAQLLLQGPTHFCDLLSGNKSDFNINDLPTDVQAALLGAGVDLFYVMTGESAASDGSVKRQAFEYAISALFVFLATLKSSYPLQARKRFAKKSRKRGSAAAKDC